MNMLIRLCLKYLIVIWQIPPWLMIWMQVTSSHHFRSLWAWDRFNKVMTRAFFSWSLQLLHPSTVSPWMSKRISMISLTVCHFRYSFVISVSALRSRPPHPLLPAIIHTASNVTQSKGARDFKTLFRVTAFVTKFVSICIWLSIIARLKRYYVFILDLRYSYQPFLCV